jgi:putrescine importer
VTEPSPASPNLDRTLTLGPVVLFGLAYMAPMIVLGTFGELDDSTGHAVPTAYLVALVAMLFTAVSYGRMARAFPVAGSAYTYTRRAVDSRIGFLVGWAVLLDYFFLPMVIWLIGASFLNRQFPDVPSWLWILAFAVVTTGLNVIGIKLAANVNLLLMIMQVLVLIFFVVLSLKDVGSTGGALLSARPFGDQSTTASDIASGAAIAAYSFLGFDAVTTLTEETKNAKRTIPRAILLVTVIGGVIFVVASYAAQLVLPHVHVQDSDSAAFDIAFTIGGNLMSAVFLAGLVVTQFASGIAAQASAARLVFAMGRDGVLPRKVFGYLHPKLRTPVVNIVLVGVVGLVATGLSASSSIGFINFGAFTAFTFVNICVIGHAIRSGRFRTAKEWLINGVVPVLGAAIDVYLLTNLDSIALIFGLVWLGLGILYLVFLTRGFRKAPPELDFREDDGAGDAATGDAVPAT